MTFKDLFLEKWVPSLITAIVGGIVVSLVVPEIQSQYAKKAALNSKRVEVYESISSSIIDLSFLMRRLGQYGRMSPEGLTQEQINAAVKDVDQTILEIRAAYKDFSTQTPHAQVFFDSETFEAIKEYDVWVFNIIKSNANTYPSEDIIRQKRDGILEVLRSDL